MGLISDGYNQERLENLGVPRLSYYSFKLMIEKLECADWNTIQTVEGLPDKVYGYKFTHKQTGEPVHVLWWDYFEEENYLKGDTKNISLNTLSATGSVKMTDAIPDFEDGIELRRS